MNTVQLFILLAALAMSLLQCTQPQTVQGGGSEVEVVGTILFQGDGPAPFTQVKLIPAGYNAATMDPIGDSRIDTTDENGSYSFNKVDSGLYNVQAVQLKQRTRLLVTDIEVHRGTILVPTDSLRAPGTIIFFLPETTFPEGDAVLPGTDIVIHVDEGSSEIVIDSVPAGRIPELRFAAADDQSLISRKDISVTPSETTTIASAWEHILPVYLNTSETGANINEDVYGFPVLIRLTENIIDFSQASPEGADIRFTSANGIPFPYEIVSWNSDRHQAVIWVKVDTIRGNNNTQHFMMLWGNPEATDASAGTTVFDTTDGYEGVWHLEESGNDSALDATANRFTGVPYDMKESGTTSGLIGNARTFDSSYLSMPNTADSRLDFGEDDNFSISVWVYADTLNDEFQTIISKGYQQYFLQLSYFPLEAGPLWQFSNFREEDHWNMSHTGASEKEWLLLTAVRNGTTQNLYVNGILNDTLEIYSHQEMDLSRETTDDFTIGRFLTEAGYPGYFGYCNFNGTLDEVHISSVSRNPAWIRLSYMNQRSDDKLVRFNK